MHAYCRESSVLLLSGTSSFLVGNLDNSSLLRGFCYMETWGRFLQDATTNGLWDHKPKNLYNRNFTVTGMSMSCLDGARTANLGTEIRLHLANKGSWKAGSPTSNPLVLKAKSRQFFIALRLYMETWGRPRKMPQQIALETTNQKIYSKQLTVTGMTCLDPARISNLDAEYLRRKIIRIHHWFTTQTSILTMFELDCDSWLNKSPLPTLWTPNEFNVLAKNGGDGFLK